MLRNVIFDYMGVLASVDYKLMASKFGLIDKFKALRILIAIKKNPVFKKAFDEYQMGLLTRDDLYNIAAEHYPRAAAVVPKILDNIPECIKENKAVLALAEKLHNDGFKVILLSNSIPETGFKIQNSDFVRYFDGFVLSHLIGMAKPNTDIFDFTCSVYDIKADESIFIDDKLENIEGAQKAKLKTMHCESPTRLANRLGNLFYSQYQPQPNE